MQKECIKYMEVRKERKNSIAGWVNYYFTIIQEDGGVVGGVDQGMSIRMSGVSMRVRKPDS